MVGIHPHILHINLDFVAVILNHRCHVQAGETGMPPGVGVEGADAHQPVHALLSAEIAVGMIAADLKGHALDARLSVVLQVGDSGAHRAVDVAEREI